MGLQPIHTLQLYLSSDSPSPLGWYTLTFSITLWSTTTG